MQLYLKLYLQYTWRINWYALHHPGLQFHMWPIFFSLLQVSTPNFCIQTASANKNRRFTIEDGYGTVSNDSCFLQLFSLTCRDIATYFGSAAALAIRAGRSRVRTRTAAVTCRVQRPQHVATARCRHSRLNDLFCYIFELTIWGA